MKSNKFLLVVLLLIVLVSWLAIGASAHDKLGHPPVKKNSVSLNILGTASYAGISYERILGKRIVGEVGIGLIGYGVGVTYYPLKPIRSKQLNAFTGIKYTNHAIVDGENKAVTYIPLGVTFFTARFFNISADIGPSFVQHKSSGYKPTLEERNKFPYYSYSIFGNLKFGFRF